MVLLLLDHTSIISCFYLQLHAAVLFPSVREAAESTYIVLGCQDNTLQPFWGHHKLPFIHNLRGGS
jgi:hypothetical protein